MLDSGDIYSVTPGKDRLVISHISGLCKPSLIKIIDNIMYRLSSSMGGGRLYRISEEADNELSLKEIGGQRLNYYYYGPIIDAAAIKSEYEEKIVGICGLNPCTIREFSRSRKAVAAKIGNLGLSCKKIWYLEADKPVLLASYLEETKVFVADLEGKFEEVGPEIFPFIKEKATIYAASYNGIILQVTENEIMISTLKNKTEIDRKKHEGIVAAVSGFLQTQVEQEYVVALSYGENMVNAYNVSAKGKISELYSNSFEAEAKSISITNGLLVVCTDYSALLIDLKTKSTVKEIALSPSEAIADGILGQSIIHTNDGIIFVGTKSGFIITLDLPAEIIRGAVKIARDAVSVGPIISINKNKAFVLALTKNAVLCVEFCNGISESKKVSRIRTREAVIDAIKLGPHLLYLDAVGDMYNVKINLEEAGMDSRGVFTGGVLEHFTRILHYPKGRVLYAIMEQKNACPLLYTFTEEGWGVVGKVELEVGRVKEVFIQTLSPLPEIPLDYLVVLSNSYNSTDETKGQLALYKISNEDPSVLEKNTTAMYPPPITAGTFFSPSYFIIACESTLYAMEVLFSGTRAKLAVICTKKLKDSVFSLN